MATVSGTDFKKVDLPESTQLPPWLLTECLQIVSAFDIMEESQCLSHCVTAIPI